VPRSPFQRSIASAFAVASILILSPLHAIPTVPNAAVPDVDGRPTNTEGEFEGSHVIGVPDDADIWDVASQRSGVFVAVGTDSTTFDSLPLVVWRSQDGLAWRETFRYAADLGLDSSFSGEARAAVAAHPGGYVVVGSYCADSCTPFALYSTDGTEWRQASVAVPAPPGGHLDQRGAGRGVSSERIVPATPDFTLRGAQMRDVVAVAGRLVAVGWKEAGEHRTAHAVWSSDDGGRTWAQADESAIGRRADYRDQLDKVVVAGDRLVATGGNRCCYEQSVAEVWVSDDGARTWQPVAFPDKPVNVSNLATAHDAVHVMGVVDWMTDGTPVHWRLSGDNRWESLPATLVGGQLLSGAPGLVQVRSEAIVVQGHRRLVVSHSPDGRDFGLTRASRPAGELALDAAMVHGDRLFAYVTVGADGDRWRLLFDAPAGSTELGNGREVWAARVRPWPVLYGEGVQVPVDDSEFVDVTPPQKSAAELVADAFFVDRDHGWALLADSVTQARRLVRTTTGGREWVPGGFGPSTEPARWVFFADRDHGWVVAYSEAGIYPKPSSLYRTSDGGATWSGPFALPACGPVHFETPVSGWLTDPGIGPGGCGSDRLHETSDGGVTWAPRRVVIPRTVPGSQVVGYGSPAFDGRVLPAWVIEDSRSRAVFLTPRDDSDVWEIAGAVDFPRRAGVYPQASVAGEGIWWAADGNGARIAVTADGGKHWGHVRPVGVRGRLVALQGVDARRAWAVETNAEGLRMMQTRDGGEHWKPL
jgi:photosystem II stability/assembly factor-like uncharacterized protein